MTRRTGHGDDGRQDWLAERFQANRSHLRGVAPTPSPDMVDHVALIALLVAGIAIAWRVPAGRPQIRGRLASNRRRLGTDLYGRISRS